tara:strand:- start:1109 stop:1318 length:210 start_codon:yes stop_codon:yes gene_type:complete
MASNKQKEEVLESHIEELKNLQKDYSNKIQVLQTQHDDFAVLIDTLSGELQRLETVDGKQVELELNTAT